MKSEDLINAYYMLQCKTELTCQCDEVSECQQCWEDSISNPDNADFIIEVAFNEGVSPQEVTQIMFNQRYSH